MLQRDRSPGALLSGEPGAATTEAGMPGQRRHIPMYVRQAVFERDGETCVKCGGSRQLVLEHVLPTDQGGADTIENLRVTCRDCHASCGG